WNTRRQNIQAGVASGYRDIPRLQPTHTRYVQSRDVRRLPWTLRRTQSPAARPNHNHISGADLYAGFLLPGVQIFRIDRRTRLEPRRPAQSRNIDQDA